MNIHTLFPEHQQFNIYGKISKLNIDFHHSLLLVGPALDTRNVPAFISLLSLHKCFTQ